jgi:hypothetical protein
MTLECCVGNLRFDLCLLGCRIRAAGLYFIEKHGGAECALSFV